MKFSSSFAMVCGLAMLCACSDDDGRRQARPDITIANLNVLHGIACPGQTRQCRFADRIALLFQWLSAANCPDIVTFQEVANRTVGQIDERRLSSCPFVYESVYLPAGLRVDDQMILSRYPVLASELVTLYRGFRTATWARIDHPSGVVDVFTTHLASSSDNAGDPCELDCPTECDLAGAATVRDCQGVQLANLVENRRDPSGVTLVSGDFNVSPDSFVYRHLAERGWLDTYLGAGNPECDSSTGNGCTAGRVDDDLSELEVAISNEVERIDYIFVVPTGASACHVEIDSVGDEDGDGFETKIFADVANPFVEVCGPAPLAVCFPSDHEGVQADINCR